MSIPILSRSVSGLRHLARAVRERGENPFYMFLMRFLWGRNPWRRLVIALVLLSAATMGIHWLLSRYVYSVVYSLPVMSRNMPLLVLFANLYAFLTSIFSPLVLISFWLARRLREFLSTPMLRDQLELVPNSRGSIADAWAVHLAILLLLLPVISQILHCIRPLCGYFSADATSPYKNSQHFSLLHYLLSGNSLVANPPGHVLLLATFEWVLRISYMALCLQILMTIQLRVRDPFLGTLGAIVAQYLLAFICQIGPISIQISRPWWRYLQDAAGGGYWIGPENMMLILHWSNTLVDIAICLPAAAWLLDFSRQRFIERPLPMEPAGSGGPDRSEQLRGVAG